METNWFIIPTREALAQVIPDSASAGAPPYLVVSLGEQAIVFDFAAMLGMLHGFNDAVQQLTEQTENRIDESQQDGADAGS